MGEMERWMMKVDVTESMLVVNKMDEFVLFCFLHSTTIDALVRP